MKKNPALKLIFAAIIIILLLIGYYSARPSNVDEIKAWDFEGAVQQVTKTLTTNNPIVSVNNKDYDLGRLHLKPGISIDKGDTLIKKKGDTVLRLIKPNTKDTIYCNKP